MGGLDRHRAVEKYREGGDPAVAEDPGEKGGQQLRAAHREGRHDHLALRRHRLLQNGDEFADRVGERPVIAVAVGGFEKNQIGLRQRLGVAQDGCALGTQIARKYNGARLAVLRGHQLQAGRTEHVAGFDPSHLQARRHGHRIVVGHGPELAEDLLGLRHGIERRDGLLAGAQAVAVVPVGVLGLDPGGVAQDQAGEVDRGRRGEDGAGKARRRQQRQTAGVIEMRVREHHGVGRRHAGTERRAVQLLRPMSALEQTAINEHPGAGGFNKVGRSGDFSPGGAENSDFHG